MSEFTLIEQEPMQGIERGVESGSTIGREGCDITVSDPDASRRHAQVEIADDGLSIEDLGSTNGTFVNGERIDQRRRLSDGDELRIGATRWIVRAPDPLATRVPDPAGAETAQSPAQATRVRPVPETAAATETASATTETAPAAAAAPSRGDVPRPEFAPSAIRRIVPVDVPTAFTPESQAGRKGSAATRAGATVMATVVIALTTAGVILYYITEPFK